MSVFIVEMWDSHECTEIFGVYSNQIKADNVLRMAMELREYPVDPS